MCRYLGGEGGGIWGGCGGPVCAGMRGAREQRGGEAAVCGAVCAVCAPMGPVPPPPPRPLQVSLSLRLA